MSTSLGRYVLSMGRVCFKLSITAWVMYFAAKTDHRVKIKESERQANTWILSEN